MNYNTSDRTITVYLVFFVRGTRNLGRRIKLLFFFICVIFLKGRGVEYYTMAKLFLTIMHVT